MVRKALVLVLVLVAVAAAYAAGAGSKLDEPIPLTPRLLAEIICAAQSDSTVTYSYDGDLNVIVGKVMPRESIDYTPAAGRTPEQIKTVLEHTHTLLKEKASRKGQNIAAFISTRVAPGARVEVK